MSGLGAWAFGNYEYGDTIPDDPDLRARYLRGVRAIKQEMIYIGKGEGIVLDKPIYGNIVRDRVKEFQAETKLVVDGKVGPRTARFMFWTRCSRIQAQSMIPERLLSKMGTLESANDPVAQGYADMRDEGWAQIHLPFYPTITIEQAHDPAFAIPWTAGRLVAAAAYCDGDYDGGVAAHNIGWTYARAWVRAGKPATGGPLIGTTDSYVRASQYVRLVKRQPVFA